MAQNIELLNALYLSVPAVLLPKQGGGTAAFTDVSDTTAAASDVATGKYFYTAAGEKTAGTASGGGGGLTSVVRGSFKYTAEGWQTISVPYTGSGYPIGLLIYVKAGEAESTFAGTLRRYALSRYIVIKDDTTSSPSYDGTTANIIVYRYKASTSVSGSYSASTSNASAYNTSESTSNAAGYVARISAQKQIKVRMVDTTHNTSRYGFLVNTDYEYLVVYSS